jgi:hypothetical protein
MAKRNRKRRSVNAKKSSPSKSIPLAIMSESNSKTRGVINLTTDSTVLMKGQLGNNYICGKCNSILLESVDRLMMQNAALKCNSCGTINNLYKKSVYIDCPITLKDLDALENPRELITCHQMWANHKLAKEFEKIHNKFLVKWEEFQGFRPNVLYHYTSQYGLENITKTGEVWFSDIAYLNDASEMKLAIDVIRNCTTNIGDSLSDIGKELLRRSEVSYSPESPTNGFFVSCFCSDGDLLSQWRAYGEGGGGYALGFNSKEMANTGAIRVRKIIYDPELQKSFVEGIVNDTLELLEKVADGRCIKDLDKDDNTLPTFCAFLSNHLTELLCSFKHESFKEEGEWRLIYDFQRDNDVDLLKFRAGKGYPVPYLEMPLSLQREGMPKSPLVEIIHGPTLHKELTSKSLELMLERENIEYVEVKSSNSPLRG